MKSLLYISILFWFTNSHAGTYDGLPENTQITTTVGELKEMQATGSQNSSCLGGILGQINQGLNSSFEAQMNESNILLGISQKYFEAEQKHGVKLTESLTRFNALKGKYESELLKLPGKIKLQQIAYKEALLNVKKECDATSGKDFQLWKQGMSTGVVTTDRGGFNALVGRNNNVNKFQKLFYDDCLVSKNNIAQVDLLAEKLAANLEILEAEMAAANKLFATEKQNLVIAQKLADDQNDHLKEELRYQEQIARNQIASTNSMTAKRTLLSLMGGASGCMGAGAGNPDVTGARAPSNTTN